jgi:Cu2+-exporting ATPase
MLLLAAVFTIAVLWAPISVSAQVPGDAAVVLHVDGMHCATCPLTVRTVLQRLDGVKKAAVSAETKTARVTYDPARVTPERMVQVVTAAGYPARAQP